MRNSQETAKEAVFDEKRCGVMDGSAVAFSPGSPWETVTKIWKELYDGGDVLAWAPGAVQCFLAGGHSCYERAADDPLSPSTLSKSNCGPPAQAKPGHKVTPS